MSVTVHRAAVGLALGLLMMFSACLGLYLGGRRKGTLFDAPIEPADQARLQGIRDRVRGPSRLGMLIFGSLLVATVAVAITTA